MGEAGNLKPDKKEKTMKTPASKLTTLAVVILAVLVFAPAPALADDAALEKRLKTEGLAMNIDDMTVRDALTLVSGKIGIEIVLSPELEKEMKEHLDKTVSMVMRSATINGVLNMLLEGTPMYYEVEDGKILIKRVKSPAAGEKDAPQAGPAVIIVVVYQNKSGVSMGKMTGYDAWFKVEEVVRFDKSLNAKLDSWDAMSVSSDTAFAEIQKRSAMLDKFYKLECALRGLGELSESTRAKVGLLEKGEKYIIALDHTGHVFTGGRDAENKWGFIRGHDVNLYKYDEKTLEDLKAGNTETATAKARTEKKKAKAAMLEMKIEPAKKTFKNASEIEIKITLTNATKKKLKVANYEPQGMEYFRFTLKDENGNPVKWTAPETPATKRAQKLHALEPGESYTTTLSLGAGAFSKAFEKLTIKTTYKVGDVAYPGRPINYWTGSVSSNEITITLEK